MGKLVHLCRVLIGMPVLWADTAMGYVIRPGGNTSSYYRKELGR